MPNSSGPSMVVTGGSGFVGRLLCKALIAHYPHSRRWLLSRDPTCKLAGWETFVGDIADQSSVSALIQQSQPDIVIHLAAQTSVAESQNAALATWRTNLQGTMALGGAVAEHCQNARVLFVSSGEVYGASLDNKPAKEDLAASPINPYSRSKLTSEYVLTDVLTKDNQLIVARPFNHTGPGQDRRFVLPSFAAQIAEIESGKKEPVIYVGNLEAHRDFLHVFDVVNAYIQLLRVAEDLPMRVTVNVSSSRPKSIRSFLDILLLLATRRIEVRQDSSRMRPADISYSCGENFYLRQLTGWQPSIGQDELCSELLDFWRSKMCEI